MHIYTPESFLGRESEGPLRSAGPIPGPRWAFGSPSPVPRDAQVQRARLKKPWVRKARSGCFGSIKWDQSIAENRKTAENLKFTALCQGEINLLSYFWIQPSSCHLSGDFPVGAACTSMLGAAPRWVVPFHPLPPALPLVEVVPDPSLRHGATAPLLPRRPAACPRSCRDSRPHIWHLITGSDDSQVSHCAVIKPQVFIQSLS